MFAAVVGCVQDDLHGGGEGDQTRYVFHMRCMQGENTHMR